MSGRNPLRVVATPVTGKATARSLAKAALDALAERKSRLVLITKLPRKSVDETNQAIICRLKKLPAKGRQTLTLDNGTENAKQEVK